MITICKIKEHKSLQLDRNFTDLLKFVACIMVAMSHYSGYALANGVSSNIVYKLIAATGGYLGVAVFFFLSGYGLMMSDIKHHLSLLDFSKRRLSKTWLPAVLVSAIWLGIAVFVDLDLLCNQQYLLGVIWRFNDEVMWFVQTIIIMYAFFYCYRCFNIKSKLCNVLLLAGVTTIAYWTVRLSDIGMSLSVPLFFGGIAVAQYPLETKKIFTSKVFYFAFAIVAIVLLWMFRHDNYLMHGWGNYVAICVFLIVLANFEIKLGRLPKWIGACSYDVYLVHYKTHLLILHYIPVDALWMFISATTVATAAFYKLRKLLRIS